MVNIPSNIKVASNHDGTYSAVISVGNGSGEGHEDLDIEDLVAIITDEYRAVIENM